MEVWQIILIVVGAFLLLLLLVLAAAYTKAGPSEAIMISGLGKKKILIGKAGFKIPFLQRKDSVSLQVFQVDIKTRESIPTNEFININVDGVANLKVSSDPALLERAFETILDMGTDELTEQIKQVLEGNMREIVGTVGIRQLVQDRKQIASKVIENVIPDMQKLGIEVVNFNIQNFSDQNHVIENLGIDNIAQISKEAAIAKANADRDVSVARAAAEKESNDAQIAAKTEILNRNTEYSLKESELKKKTETARADADVAYAIQREQKQAEINRQQVNAQIAQREKEVELKEKEVAVQERKLRSEVEKVAEAQKYAAQQAADADLYKRQKAAEAELIEAQRQAEKVTVEAEAEKAARTAASEAQLIEAENTAKGIEAEAKAKKVAALFEADGIKAKGTAEANAIKEKADAMKHYDEAAMTKMILESNLIPETVKAYAEPIAAALGQIDGITMYGDGNQAKLVAEIQENGDQIFAGLNKALGIDVKSVIAGFLGGKLLGKGNKEGE